MTRTIMLLDMQSFYASIENYTFLTGKKLP